MKCCRHPNYIAIGDSHADRYDVVTKVHASSMSAPLPADDDHGCGCYAFRASGRIGWIPSSSQDHSNSGQASPMGAIAATIGKAMLSAI